MQTSNNGWARLIQLLSALAGLADAWRVIRAFIADAAAGHLRWTLG